MPPSSGCQCTCACQTGAGSDPQVLPNVASAIGSAFVSLGSIFASAVSTALASALPTYSSRSPDPDSGYGWSLPALPAAFETPTGVSVAFDANDATWFTLSGSTYTAQFGSQETLSHVGTQYVMTDPDGTVYEFNDFTQPDSGDFVESVAPGGATTVVTTQNADGQPLTIDFQLSPGASPYQEIQYTYPDSGANAGHISSVELLGQDPTTTSPSLLPVQEVQYSYYVTGDLNGLTGDLKTAELYQSNGNGWTSVGTTYFRYYTTNDAGGFAHGLERVLLPVAYAKALADFGGSQTYLDDASDTTLNSYYHTIADYTCYYFTYDANQRVSGETVYGQSGTWATTTYTANAPSTDFNVWQRETVTAEPDGATSTVYFNYIGETMLSDLSDGGSQTITYDRYDGNGNLLWTAQPSAFQEYGGGWYDSSSPNLIDYVVGTTPYDGTSDYLKSGGGLIDVYAYYSTTVPADTSLDPSSSNAGGVANYLQASGVEDGTGSTPIWQTSLNYVGEEVDGVTAYYTWQSTQYQNDYSSSTAPTPTATAWGINTTTYKYWFWSTTGNSNITSPTIQEEITAQPVISAPQNGSGSAAQTIDWYNSLGQLEWEKDGNGSVTYDSYDPSSNLVTTIQDIGYTAAQNLGVPSDLSPASGYVGIAAETDYAYDSMGRLVQTLGPEHSAVVDGTATDVRTASWTVYDDADQTTYTVQGYQTVVSGCFTLVNPISVETTNLNGEVTADIEATVVTGGGVVGWYSGEGAITDEVLLAGDQSPQGLLSAVADGGIGPPPQASYTAWTTYQYSHTHLASMRVYYNIAEGLYNQTTYAYENDAANPASAGQTWMGRQNITETADGTYTQNVLDAQGNVLSTWVGTDDFGETDSNPAGIPGQNAGNNMVEVSANAYNADGLLQMAVTQTLNVDATVTPVSSAGTVAVSASNTGSGYLMYSAQSVLTRFALASGNDSFIAVVWNSAQNCWEYDSGSGLLPFSPLPTDVLVAGVNFSPLNVSTYYFGVATSLVNGIQEGYGGSTSTNTLSFSTGTNCFTVTGSSFVENLSESVTLYGYDWQDRQTYVVAPPDAQGDVTYTMTSYDNLGEATDTRQYLYNGSNLWADLAAATGDPPAPLSTGALLAWTHTDYDSLGQVYESDDYNVLGGSYGDYLPTYTWYDADGNVIKTQTGTTGSFEKYSYDGLGNVTMDYVGYDAAPEDYAEASMVNGNDTILQLTQTWYDGAGEAVGTATYEQFADGTPVTGPLDATDSYATASVTWYDGIGRTSATADFGREDAAAPLSETRYFFNSYGTLNAAADGLPSITEQAPLPTDSSLDYIATATAYDPAGNVYQTTDNTGSVTESLYDAAGRTVITIQSYQAGGITGTISATDSDAQVAAELQAGDESEDITTKYDYDSKGRLVTMIAYDANGSSVQPESTEYLYGSTVNASWQTAEVDPGSTDSLSPDSNGDWSVSGADHTSTTYDWQGRVLTTTDPNDLSLPVADQRGVTHTYTYDLAGQVVLDSATIPAASTGVDQSVLSIGTTYDDLGRVQTVTSYSTTDGTGTPVNQVEDSYDGWGNLAEEWQSHAGAVDTSDPPSVEYTYLDGPTTGVAGYLRLSQIAYPSAGSTVNYNYPAGVDAVMSRLVSITRQ